MTTYCSSYAHPAAANDAVDRLLAAGVDGDDIRVLMGAPDHDDDPTGTFAGAVTAGAPLGTFADRAATTTWAASPAVRRRCTAAASRRSTARRSPR